jgi:hypothetical protein
VLHFALHFLSAGTSYSDATVSRSPTTEGVKDMTMCKAAAVIPVVLIGKMA